MKKIVIFTIITSICIAFGSCSQDDIVNDVDNSLEALKTKSSVIDIENDTILELDEDSFPKIERVKARSTGYVDIWSELYQLNGIDFFIQSTGYNYGINTLETTGKGKELKLSALNYSNNKQKFRMKFLPASTGIPYLIYSTAESVPIGVGSYASNPNKYVLYAKSSDSGSLFGFSWDFYMNTTQDAYILENQDIIGGGSDYWDIYWHAITINSDGTISLTKRTNSLNQQFTLIPDDDYELMKIELQHNMGVIVSSKPVILEQNGISNGSSTEMMTHQFSYKKSQSDGTTFQEQKSITTKKTGGLSIGLTLSKVVTLGGSASLEKGEQKTLTYGTSQTMLTEITKTTNFNIPPRQRAVYTFSVYKHELDVPYIATFKGRKSQQEIKIRGQWEGVDYTLTDLKVDYYSLDNLSLKLKTSYIQ